MYQKLEDVYTNFRKHAMCVNSCNRGPSFVQLFVDHNAVFCDSNCGPIVPFVIGPALNVDTYPP